MYVMLKLYEPPWQFVFSNKIIGNYTLNTCFSKFKYCVQYRAKQYFSFHCMYELFFFFIINEAPRVHEPVLQRFKKILS